MVGTYHKIKGETKIHLSLVKTEESQLNAQLLERI